MKNYLLLCLPFLVSCYQDKEELLYPSNECDKSVDVSYSTQVLPILSNDCYTCHNTQNAPNRGAGLVLDNYTDLKSAIENRNLLSTINHESGFSEMPKGGSKMNACDITILETWVLEGSKDN